MNKTVIIFGLFFLFIALIFRNAFSMHFMSDDYSFFKISQANSLSEFLYFFYPIKEYFFRPIPTEVYYFLLRLTGTNFFLGHMVVFFTYFVGLYVLFKISLKLTKKEALSYLFTFMYGISFIHVFQLYMFNTFQEICLFTFLSISFYFYITKRLILSFVFFLLALLSKETAILFPIMLFAYDFARKRDLSLVKKSAPFLTLSAIFTIIYRAGVSGVEQIEIYQIHYSPSLILNNLAWYVLWALGFPNFLPNYVKSILLKPLPEFWNVLNLETIKFYFYVVVFYMFSFAATLTLYLGESRKIRTTLLIGAACATLFLLFVSPTLPIIHRWMVRLTIPLIFLIFFEAFIIYKAFSSRSLILRASSIMLILFYFYINLIGVGIHESSGLFVRQNKIFLASQQFYKENYDQIVNARYIYFADSDFDVIGGSKLLKESYHDQDFLDYFFPSKEIKAIYAFEYDSKIKLPKGTFAIESKDLIPY